MKTLHRMDTIKIKMIRIRENKELCLVKSKDLYQSSIDRETMSKM